MRHEFRWARVVFSHAAAFILVIGIFQSDVVFAQRNDSGDAAAGPVFVSSPVTPGVSPKVWALPNTEAVVEAGRVREVNPRRTGSLPSESVEEAEAMGESPPAPDGNVEPHVSFASPEPLFSFEGISATGSVPPDTVGDVGPNHYVQMVNTSFAIFDKAGNILQGPVEINQLWTGQGNACETFNDGDPIVLYDPLADRWLLCQLSLAGDFDNPPWYMCVALSQTPDPTGSYFLYAFEITDVFPDYPKFGVWPDAYYMSSNDEPNVGAYAFDRANMLAGQPAVFQKIQVHRNFMLPGDLDGPTPPPPGSPNYFYTMMDDTVWPNLGVPGPDRLEVWEFHVDFTVPANSTFSLAASLPTTPFIYTVCGFFNFDCIPQKDVVQRVDAVSEWPMWRLQYRNFGTHETLVGNFTVDVDNTNHAGIRWFELRKTAGGSSWSIHQEGTHSPDENHRWMGSIAMDMGGNIALGYSVSSIDLYPSIRYATRLAGDPPGSLQDEATLISGTGSQIFFDRWGDYSSMNVDPEDGRTFWYTNEYYETIAPGLWRTRIGAFRIDRQPVEMIPTLNERGSMIFVLSVVAIAVFVLNRKRTMVQASAGGANRTSAR